MIDNHTLLDFQVTSKTTNSRRNFRFRARSYKTNENTMLSEISSKYQTGLTSAGWNEDGMTICVRHTLRFSVKLVKSNLQTGPDFRQPDCKSGLKSVQKLCSVF